MHLQLCQCFLFSLVIFAKGICACSSCGFFIEFSTSNSALASCNNMLGILRCFLLGILFIVVMSILCFCHVAGCRMGRISLPALRRTQWPNTLSTIGDAQTRRVSPAPSELSWLLSVPEEAGSHHTNSWLVRCTAGSRDVTIVPACGILVATKTPWHVSVCLHAPNNNNSDMHYCF